MTKPSVMLVDDDASLLDIVSMAMEDAGYRVVTASDGVEALACMAQTDVDLVVSDVNMPQLDGFSLVRRMRVLGNHVPVLLLTSRDSEVDEALGLDLGADDFMTKPFSTRVLVARVSALLRRNQMLENEARPEIVVGALCIQPDQLAVRWSGHPIALTVTEFRLVGVLSSQPGVVLSRSQLMDVIRGDDSVVEARIIDTYVRRVRRKFEAVDGDFEAIQTVIGAGYRWVA
jgi:DNA-binding response OmpR family regulator